MNGARALVPRALCRLTHVGEYPPADILRKSTEPAWLPYGRAPQLSPRRRIHSSLKSQKSLKKAPRTKRLELERQNAAPRHVEWPRNIFHEAYLANRSAYTGEAAVEVMNEFVGLVRRDGAPSIDDIARLAGGRPETIVIRPYHG
jgi:hypothetical protein